MTRLLDFTAAGRTGGHSAPPRAPESPPPGSGRRPVRSVVLVVGVLALVVATGFLLLSRGGTSTGKAQTVARYCQLTQQFDRLVPAEGSAAGPADASAGNMSRLLQDMGATVGEMEAAAPAEIRSDVRATVDAVRQAAKGNLAAIRSASFQARRQRIAKVQQRQCPGGALSNEQ